MKERTRINKIAHLLLERRQHIGPAASAVHGMSASAPQHTASESTAQPPPSSTFTENRNASASPSSCPWPTRAVSAMRLKPRAALADQGLRLRTRRLQITTASREKRALLLPERPTREPPLHEQRLPPTLNRVAHLRLPAAGRRPGIQREARVETTKTKSASREWKWESNRGSTRADPHSRFKRTEGPRELAASPHAGTEHARGSPAFRAFPHPARHTGMAGSR